MASKDVVLRFLADTKGLKTGLDSAGGSFNKLKMIGVGAFVAMAAASAAFVADSLKVGAGFEKTMTEARAVSRATQAEYAAMSAKARELGATTAFTAQEAAEGFVILSRAGFDAAQSIAAIDATMLLAGATATDMNTATSAVVATLSQFNMDASESAKVADIFAQAASQSMFDVTGLANAMKFAGTTGAAFGQSLEETTAATMMLRNLGLEASQVGTTYRMAMTQMAVGTDKQVAVLKGLGLTMSDVDIQTNSFGEILQTLADSGMTASDSMQFFGNRAGSGMAALIKNAQEGKNQFEEFANGLKNSGGEAARQYALMMDTVSGRAAIVKSAFEEIKLSIFDAFGNTVKESLGGTSDILQSIGGVLRANMPLLQEITRAFFTMFTAVKTGGDDVQVLGVLFKMVLIPVIAIIGQVATAINAIKLAWLAVKTVAKVVVDAILIWVAALVDGFTGTISVIAKVAGVFDKELGAKINASVDNVRAFSRGIKDEVEKDFQDIASDVGGAVDGMVQARKAQQTAIAAAAKLDFNAIQETITQEQEKAGAINGATKAIDEQTDAIKKNIAAAEPVKIKESDYFGPAMPGAGDFDAMRKASYYQATGGTGFAGDFNMPMPSQEQMQAQIEQMKILGFEFETLKTLGTGMFSSFESGLAGFITNFATGAESFGESLKGMFVGFGQSIISMLSKIAAKMATMKILSLVAGLGTGGISTLAGSILGSMGSRHTGGAIHETGSYVLQRGEYVLNQKTMDNPQNASAAYYMNKNSDKQGAKTLNVNIPTSSETPYYKKILRQGGAFNEALRDLGLKVVVDGS